MAPEVAAELKFIQFVGEHIDVYFTTNTEQTSASTRWEAFKAYIRGQILSFTGSKFNKFKQKIGHGDGESGAN